jgi:hypothetical protein
LPYRSKEWLDRLDAAAVEDPAQIVDALPGPPKATADLEVTFRGDAYAIRPGATYVIEVDAADVTADRIAWLRHEFERVTGAHCLFLVGGHLVPADLARARPEPSPG